jgi:hypothetical protein
VRAALSKLRASTGNEFVEVRDSPDGAGAVRLLVCPSNPLPEQVSLDFDAVDRFAGNGTVAFATDVEGDPHTFDPRLDPHLLVVGGTGSGKSSLLQALLFGFLRARAEVYLIDPVKGAADYRFAERHLRGMATDAETGAAVMRSVYAEVEQRKKANAAAGVGSFRELPDPPPMMVVLIDEFSALIGKSPAPKRSGNPELDLEIERIEEDHRARLEIGIYAGKIAREARSAGVAIILATQRLSAKMLDDLPSSSDLRTNLSRILLGRASWGDRVAALRSPDDAPQLEGQIPKGRGLFETTASTAQVVQCWYAPQPELAAQLAKRWHPLNDCETDDVAANRREKPGRITPDPADLDRRTDPDAPYGEVRDNVKNAMPRASGLHAPADDWGVPLDWGSPRPAAPLPETALPDDNDWPLLEAHTSNGVSVRLAEQVVPQDRDDAEW